MKRLGILPVVILVLITAVAVFLYFIHHYDMIGGGMRGEHMMGNSQSGDLDTDTSGLKVFNANCRRCHPNGGNIFNPAKPLRGSHMLADFNTFLSFIRDPGKRGGSKSVMPSFPESIISDQQAKELYQYVITL